VSLKFEKREFHRSDHLSAKGFSVPCSAHTGSAYHLSLCSTQIGVKSSLINALLGENILAVDGSRGRLHMRHYFRVYARLHQQPFSPGAN
jgi:hypothetical protein